GETLVSHFVSGTLKSFPPEEIESVVGIVGLHDEGDEEIIDHEMDHENPEEALGFFKHASLGPGKKEDDEYPAAGEGHVVEHRRVEHRLHRVGETEGEERTQQGEGGVDEK